MRTALFRSYTAFSTLLVLAMASPAKADVTGNLSLVSDYAFRGISQTWERPAIQGGFDYTHPSGFYLGTWASNVSGNSFANASMEWDFYGGYNWKVNDDFSVNAGLLQYYYPGGKTAPVAPNDKYDTLEAYIGATWKWINLKYSHTLTDYFGVSSTGLTPCNFATGICDPTNGNSKGSGYVELNINYELPQKFMLGFHVGHQKVRHYGNLDYTDYKLSVTKELAGFNVGLAYVDTDADENYYTGVVNGDRAELSDGRVILSVGKTF